MLDTPDPDAATYVLARVTGHEIVERAGHRITFPLNGIAPERLHHELVGAGVPVREFVIERPTLEDAFLDLTGGIGDVRP